MSKYLKDGEIAENDWITIVEDFAGELPEGKLLLHTNTWLNYQNKLSENAAVGIWLHGDEDPSVLAQHINKLPVIAVQFPTFMDGRGFSLGTTLRTQYNFSGELRAIGHIIRDQLFFLKRCGFNGIALPEGIDIEQAKSSLADFSESYQSAIDTAEPLFKRQTL